MKSYRVFLFSLIAVGTFLSGGGRVSAQNPVWATAYYAGWMQGDANNGYLPAQEIDYTAVTHIIHFSIEPNSNGTLNADGNGINVTNSSALISRAHAAGKKVIICVGGWGSDAGFRSATKSGTRAAFIANLVSFMTSRGYDGIDIDWEVLEASDETQYVAFITGLRTALNAISPRPLLMAATAWQPAIFAKLHTQFDQINLMTYDLSGAWQGWVTWHNAPIYDGGFTFPGSGGRVPSIDGEVQEYVAAGIPVGKLGVGIDFYGYAWSGGTGTPTGGATEPRQSWTTAPSVQDNIPYSTIMDTYYQAAYYQWDAAAQAAYLKIDKAGSSTDKFVSYDNETSVQKKFDYARAKGLGGLIVWELGGGYRANKPAGQRDLLLQAVKQALLGSVTVPPVAPVVSTPANGATGVAVSSTFRWGTSNGAASYGVQVSAASGFTSTIFNQQGITATSVTVAGLAAGSSYYWRVNAVNAAGASPWSSVGQFTTASASTRDSIAPVVTITAPAQGATLSGNVNVSANVTDNKGVASVQFLLDSVALGGLLSVPPYTVVWETGRAANGAHTIAVTARDSAGNTTSRTVSVVVQNSIASAESLKVYDDVLRTPWMDASWGTTATFNSTQKVYAGVSSIALKQSGWGGLRLRNGGWGTGVDVKTSRFQNLEAMVWGGASGLSLAVNLENDAQASFPTVISITVPANTWRLVSIPLSQLNPGNKVVHSVVFQNNSGTTKTYAADNIRFVGAPQAPAARLAMEPLAAPTEYTLDQNYPNPFNPTTAISFTLPEQTEVSVRIYNVLGEQVALLLADVLPAGRYATVWNAQGVPSGNYLCRLSTPKFTSVRKLVLTK